MVKLDLVRCGGGCAILLPGSYRHQPGTKRIARLMLLIVEQSVVRPFVKRKLLINDGIQL